MEPTRRPRRGMVWAAVAVLALGWRGVATVAAGDDRPTAKARHAQKWVYDDATGRWQASVPPIPGTEDGDLEIIRQELAQGQAKKARKLLKNWLKKYPDSTRVPEAQFLQADAELALKNFMRAYKGYERLIGSYADTEWFDRCLERELVIAEVFLSGRKQKVLWGLLRFPAQEEALEMLGRIRERKPGSRLSERALRIQAEYHFRNGQFAEAEDAYAMLAKEFPRGRNHANALFHAAEAAMAGFPGVRFDDSALVEARVRLLAFQKKYPQQAGRKNVVNYLQTIRAKRAEKEFSIARWYLKIKKSDAAVFYFRSVVHHWPETVWAERAQAELRKMGRLEPSAPAESM